MDVSTRARPTALRHDARRIGVPQARPAAPPAMAARPAVARVVGGDPLLRAGVLAFLSRDPRVVPLEGAGPCDVLVVVAASVDEQARALVRSHSGGEHAVLLLADRLDAAGVGAAVRLGALGVLRRAGLGPDALTGAVASVARREAVVPPDLLGELFGQAREGESRPAAPAGLSALRLSERERDVLRHLADGADTREIARSLRYSERTVKTVIQDVTRRFGLRNRAHAVAYALRNGLL